MRNLEHIGAQVGAGVDQLPLSIYLGVPREQHAHPVHSGAQDERGVVRIGSTAMKCARGTEDVQLHCTDDQVRAGRRRADDDTA